MRVFVDHIELWLSAAGLAVILAVPALFSGDVGPWKLAAVTAIAVGVIHGLIFWLVRRRQRRVRAETIGEVSEMLRDVVNNQLTVILAHRGVRRAEDVERVRTSVHAVSQAVNSLSEESLRSWRSRYARLLDAPGPEGEPG